MVSNGPMVGGGLVATVVSRREQAGTGPMIGGSS
jgi:hypothetical protein